ncbi:hypothetical protein ACJX0J_042592, partial [Zea mays]
RLKFGLFGIALGVWCLWGLAVNLGARLSDLNCDMFLILQGSSGQYIRATLPYIRADIPIIIVFRALGFAYVSSFKSFSLNAHRYAKEILQKEMHTILGISEPDFLTRDIMERNFIPFKLIYKVASEIRPADFVPFRIPVDHRLQPSTVFNYL